MRKRLSDENTMSFIIEDWGNYPVLIKEYRVNNELHV